MRTGTAPVEPSVEERKPRRDPPQHHAWPIAVVAGIVAVVVLHWCHVPQAALSYARIGLIPLAAFAFALVLFATGVADDMAKHGLGVAFARNTLWRNSIPLAVGFALMALLAITSAFTPNADVLKAVVVASAVSYVLLGCFFLRCQHLKTLPGAVGELFARATFGEIVKIRKPLMDQIAASPPAALCCVSQVGGMLACRLGECRKPQTTVQLEDSHWLVTRAESVPECLSAFKPALCDELGESLRRKHKQKCFDLLVDLGDHMLNTKREVDQHSNGAERESLLWHVSDHARQLIWPAFVCGRCESTGRGNRAFRLAGQLESVATEGLEHDHYTLVGPCLDGLRELGTITAAVQDWHNTAMIATAIKQVGDGIVGEKVLVGEFAPLIKALHTICYVLRTTTAVFPCACQAPEVTAGTSPEKLAEQSLAWAEEFRNTLKQRAGNHQAVQEVNDWYNALFGPKPDSIGK